MNYQLSLQQSTVKIPGRSLRTLPTPSDILDSSSLNMYNVLVAVGQVKMKVQFSKWWNVGICVQRVEAGITGLT